MQTNFCNFKSEEEYGSRTAMQMKLSTEQTCKQNLNFKYQRCYTALHATTLQCKADQFS